MASYEAIDYGSTDGCIIAASAGTILTTPAEVEPAP